MTLKKGEIMNRKNKVLNVVKRLFCGLLSAAALCGMVQGPELRAEPAYDSAYTDTYSMEYLLIPALRKNTDVNGVYRQLRMGLLYKSINEGNIAHMYFVEGVQIPLESLCLLYNDGLISGYLLKSVAGIPYSAEDITPIFDANYYYNKYEDIRKNVGYDPGMLFMHFMLVGMPEGRSGCKDFDPRSYKELNPDIAKAYGDNYSLYYYHYMMYGRFERRKK